MSLCKKCQHFSREYGYCKAWLDSVKYYPLNVKRCSEFKPKPLKKKK